MIVDTIVFDESQITSRQNGNHPTWGGNVPLIVYGLDVSPGTFFAGTAFDETSITLKACGGGGVALIDLSDNNRDAEPRSASGELQRTGRMERYAGDR